MLNIAKNILVTARTKKKFILIATVGIVFLSLLYTLAIPPLINIDQYRNKIIKENEHRVKGPVKVGHLQLELPITGGIVIKTGSLTITHKNGTSIADAKNVKLKIAILPLLFNQIVVKDLETDYLKLNVIKKDSWKTDIDDLLLPPQPKDKFLITFKHTKAFVKKYHITLIDQYIQPNKTFSLNGDNIHLFNFTKNKLLMFSFNGILDNKTSYKVATKLTLPLKKDLFSNKFFIKGNINNLYLEDIAPYCKLKNANGKISTEFKLNQSNGNLNIQNKTYVKNRVSLPNYKLTLKNGSINLVSSINKQNINIDNLSIKANKINTLISGSISRWKSKKPNLDLKIQTNEFNLRDIYNTLPQIKETRFLLENIKTYKPEGFTKLNLAIKGTLKKPHLYGQIPLKKCTLKLPNNILLSNINSTLNFNGNTVQLKKCLIPLSDSSLLKIDGDIDFINKRFLELNVYSNALSLDSLKNTVISISKITNTPLSVLNGSEVNGFSKLNLVLNGKIKKPSIKGELILDTKTLKLTNLKTPLSNIKGKLLFDKFKVTTKDFNIGLTPKSTLKVNGEYNFYEKVVKELNIKSPQVDLNQIWNILISLNSLSKTSDKVLERIKITGYSDLNLNIKGNLNSLKPYGKATLSNVQILDTKTKLPINNINGVISFNNTIYLNNLSAMIENNKINISGKSSPSGISDFIIKITNFKLNDIKNLTTKLKLLSPSTERMVNSSIIDGSVSGNLTVTTDGKDFITEALININKSKIIHPKLPDTLNILKGQINLKNDKVSVSNLSLITGDSRLNVSGIIKGINSHKPDYSLEVIGSNLTLDLIRKLSKHSDIPKEIQDLIANVDKTTGSSKINFKVNNKGFELNINLEKLSIYLKQLHNPIANIMGKIKLTNNSLNITGANAEYGKSKIQARGNINNLMTTPYIDIALGGAFSPVDFNEFILDDINKNLTFSEPIKFEGFAKGDTKNWDIKFTSSLPPSAKVAIKGLLQKPESVPVDLVLDGKGSPQSVNIEKILFKIGDSEVIASGSLLYSKENLLLFDNLHIQIPIINLDQINEFFDKELLLDKLAGKIQSDLKVSGALFNPDILGFINLSNVSLPILKTKDVSINIGLSNQGAYIDGKNLNINGTVFKFNGNINNFKQLPLEFTNLKVYSPSLRLTDLLSAASERTQTIDFLPITVKNGLLTIDDAIIEKLITTNLTGSISLCSNGMLQLTNLSLNTAGGKAKGDIYVNLLKETLGAQLQIVGVKANAAATVLLDLPNEVFGDLNTTIVFDSKGTNYEEILSNAKGQASLIITNGRFTRLGTLEHLLTASNIISGGITDLSLNSIIGSIIPTHTGHFELLTGDFTADKGILHTDNLITRGKNLGLEISGDINIATEDADLDIKGNLSRNISGLLGALGKLNLATLTDFIPGLGFIPGISKSRGILDFIPGLGFIPGFGGPKRDNKIRKFAVELQGNLYDTSSVKNFRWTK